VIKERHSWSVTGAKVREGVAISSEEDTWAGLDRIIPCRGDVIESRGKAIPGRITEWFWKSEP
jgi:hypothetical protein